MALGAGTSWTMAPVEELSSATALALPTTQTWVPSVEMSKGTSMPNVELGITSTTAPVAASIWSTASPPSATQTLVPSEEIARGTSRLLAEPWITRTTAPVEASSSVTDPDTRVWSRAGPIQYPEFITQTWVASEEMSNHAAVVALVAPGITWTSAPVDASSSVIDQGYVMFLPTAYPSSLLFTTQTWVPSEEIAVG